MNKHRLCKTVLCALTLALAAAASPAPSPTHPDAEYQQHVQNVKAKLAKQGEFSILIEKPFVVAGNDTPEQLRATATATVRWTVEHLKKDFFAKDPTDIIDVYLFKDKASFDKANKDLFPGAPDTPYGYYSPTHNALIMNIGSSELSVHLFAKIGGHGFL